MITLFTPGYLYPVSQFSFQNGEIGAKFQNGEIGAKPSSQEFGSVQQFIAWYLSLCHRAG